MVASSMHEELKVLLNDVEAFLREIQKNEKLSPSGVRGTNDCLKALLAFKKSNEEIFTSTDDVLYDDTDCAPAALQPGSSAEVPPVEEELYEDTDFVEKTSLTKTRAGSAESKPEVDDAGEIKIAAKDIENAQMSGYLDKKKKSDSAKLAKIFSGGFKTHYVVLKETTLYFYKKESDKAQKESLNILAYDIRPIPNLGQDKAKKSFQLFCPAKATYEFMAPNNEECKKWKRALQTAWGKNTLDSVSTSEGADDIDDFDADDIYDEADAVVTEKVEPVEAHSDNQDTYEATDLPQPEWGRPSPPPPDDELYEDTVAPPPRPPPKLPGQKPVATLPGKTQGRMPAPLPVEEEIYDDTALTNDDIYDDAAVPAVPSRPPPMKPHPPAVTPVEDDIYDETDLPPPVPPPQKNLPKPQAQPQVKPMQSRPPAPAPAPAPEIVEDELYDDVETVMTRAPQAPSALFAKSAPKTGDPPGIENYDDMYLSKWDHNSGRHDELNMKRGDMIHILDKLYKDWWVGKNGAQVGLVPPVYLMKAYDICVE